VIVYIFSTNTTECLEFPTFFQELERECPETPVGKNLPMFNKVLTGVSMLEALVSERVTSTTLASKKKCSYSGIPPGT